METVHSRVLPLSKLLDLAQEWKEAGETVVFTNGCFDILHLGHLQTLTKAKQQGSKLVVGLNSDASVARLKGPSRPVNSESDRALLLAGLRCVDAVVIFSEDTPIPVLEALKPQVHVKGGDYRVEDLAEAQVVQENGGRVVIIDLLPGRSTTGLIEKTRTS